MYGEKPFLLVLGTGGNYQIGYSGETKRVCVDYVRHEIDVCKFGIVICNCSKNKTSFRAVLRGHKKKRNRRQKRTTFYVKSSSYFTFYVGHSTRQTISLHGVSKWLVGVGKKQHRPMVIQEKAAPVAGTTLRFTGPMPADSRQ